MLCDLWTCGGLVNNKEDVRSFNFLDIVSYALKMGVTHVFVVYFRTS